MQHVFSSFIASLIWLISTSVVQAAVEPDIGFPIVDDKAFGNCCRLAIAEYSTGH